VVVPVLPARVVRGVKDFLVCFPGFEYGVVSRSLLHGLLPPAPIPIIPSGQPSPTFYVAAVTLRILSFARLVRWDGVDDAPPPFLAAASGSPASPAAVSRALPDYLYPGVNPPLFSPAMLPFGG